MVTKLQDIANKVAQSKISNARLRNEEIRRQMAMPWSEPTMPKEQYTPTQSTINPSQSNTLSGMFGSESDRTTSTNTSSVGSMPDSLAGALPGIGSMAASRAGLGAMSPAVGGAISGALDDWGGAIKGGATGLAAALGAGRHAGLVGTFARDMYNDIPAVDMFGNLAKQATMSAAFKAVPALGAIYGLASIFGLNLDQGFRDAIHGYKGPPGFQGPLNGFFGKNQLGLGIGLPGPSDTPLGFDPSDLGTGIYGALGDLFGPSTTDTTAPGFSTSDLGTGLKGSLDTSNWGNWGNWGVSPDDSTSDTSSDSTGSSRGEPVS